MKKVFTLGECAKTINAQLVGDGSLEISGINALDKACISEVSFLHNKKYTSLLKTTEAGAVCISSDSPLTAGKNYLVVEDPSKAFTSLTELLMEDHSPSGFTGRHPTAVIHQSAKIGSNVQIGPYVVIDRDVVVGDGTVISPHASIGPKSTIGKECLIHSNVVIREDCHFGSRVILQPSCVIGGCGYGYDSCTKTGVHTKIKHYGQVVLEDDVEIGASTTIDRGRFDKTIIRSGTKIDNQCMIAHNCDIGHNNLIVSMSGIAGSTKTGRNVIIAAQCGILGHIELGDNVTLAARSAPRGSIKEPGVYFGSPAQKFKDEVKEKIALKKLPEVLKKLKKAEKFFESIEENSV